MEKNKIQEMREFRDKLVGLKKDTHKGSYQTYIAVNLSLPFHDLCIDLGIDERLVDDLKEQLNIWQPHRIYEKMYGKPLEDLKNYLSEGAPMCFQYDECWLAIDQFDEYEVAISELDDFLKEENLNAHFMDLLGDEDDRQNALDVFEEVYGHTQKEVFRKTMEALKYANKAVSKFKVQRPFRKEIDKWLRGRKAA